MSRRRVLLFLAIVAALAGAPSSVSAASPNQLSQASVAPLAGEPSTVFVVSVRYRSPAGNPATTIHAEVAGQVTTLILVTGTATDGVWSGATTLPPGSWQVEVEASVANGPQPRLTVGPVSVGAASPSTAPGSGTPSFAIGPAEGGGASTPAPAPVATAVPRAATSPKPARNSQKAAPSQPPAAPAGGAVTPVARGGRGESPARSPRPNPAAGSQGELSSVEPSPTATGEAAPRRANDDLGLFMLLGTLGVGLVALLGSAWIILAGRRDRRARALVGDPAPTDPGIIAAAIVEQRAMRRARLRSADDPILSAMGLPEQDATRPPPQRSGPARRRTRRRPPKR